MYTQENTSESTRGKGLFMALVGLGLSIWQVVLPFLAARSGAESISFMPKIQFAGILLLFLGIPVVVLGDKLSGLFQGANGENYYGEQMEGRDWLVLLVGIALAIGACVGVNHYFSALGYQRNGGGL
jgi:hypothetical protein